jgi:hypothetical protein
VSGARADAVTRGFAISWLTCKSVLLRDTLLKLCLFLVATISSNLLLADLSTGAFAQILLVPLTPIAVNGLVRCDDLTLALKAKLILS